VFFSWSCFRHQYAHHQEYNIVNYNLLCPALKRDIKLWGLVLRCSGLRVAQVMWCGCVWIRCVGLVCVALHYIVLLLMGILMPDTCWAKEHWIKSICVASVGSLPYLSLRCTFTWTSNKEFMIIWMYNWDRKNKKSVHNVLVVNCPWNWQLGKMRVMGG
jgi:hypothetical protein